MPGTVLDTLDTAVEKTGKIPSCMFLWLVLSMSVGEDSEHVM